MDRFTPVEAGTAIERLGDTLGTPVAQYGPVQEIYFPAASVRVPVRHGLDVIPTGYQFYLTVDGEVRAADVSTWTADVAYLVATADHTRARVGFVALREEVRNG